MCVRGVAPPPAPPPPRRAPAGPRGTDEMVKKRLRGRSERARVGFEEVLCLMRFEGTVLSHDVNEELAGIAHGVLEGLATGGELGRNGR